LDEKIGSQKRIFPFGFRLRRFPEKKISCIEKKDSFVRTLPWFDQCRFLGDTAKWVPESPARFNLSHHVIRIDDAEPGWGCCFNGRDGE
jgi:hypothetical protein